MLPGFVQDDRDVRGVLIELVVVGESELTRSDTDEDFVVARLSGVMRHHLNPLARVRPFGERQCRLVGSAENDECPEDGLVASFCRAQQSVERHALPGPHHGLTCDELKLVTTKQAPLASDGEERAQVVPAVRAGRWHEGGIRPRPHCRTQPVNGATCPRRWRRSTAGVSRIGAPISDCWWLVTNGRLEVRGSSP